MSFFYQTSAAAARSRRTKERDGQSRTNTASTGGRRHRSASKNQDTRSPPSKSPTLQASIYTQQNLALDQLPPLPPSESTTPAFNSPSSSFHQSQPSRSNIFQLTQQPFTPVALQQYLDQDDDDAQEDNDEDQAIAWSDTRSASAKTDVGRPQEIDIKGNTSLRSNRRPSISEYLSSNDHTPRAYPDEGSIYFDAKSGSTSKATKIDPSSVSRKEKHDPPNQLAAGNWNKEGTSSSSTIGSMEEFYKRSPKPQLDSISQTAATIRRRPFSQVISDVDMREISSDTADIQYGMVRSPSQQSAPLLSRAFTPPPFPQNTSREPSSTPPVYVSPMPLRSRMPGDYYGAFNASPSQHTRPPLRGPNIEYSGSIQSYSELQPNTMVPMPSFSSVYGSTVSELRKTQSNEERVEDPALILYKLQSVLPHLQMLISRSQYYGGGDPVPAHDPAHVSTLKKLQEMTIKVQQLEMKLDERETKHRQEIDSLNAQIIELQIQSKHFQSDAASQKESRDTLYEELVMLRVESELAAKTLHNDKRDLQDQIETIQSTTRKLAGEKIDHLREEVEAKNTLINTLQTQFGVLQTSRAMEQESAKNIHEQKYQEKLNEHKWVVQDFERQLQNELAKSTQFEEGLEQVQHKMEDELGRRDDELQEERSKLIADHQNQLAALSLDLNTEKEERKRVKDDNTRLREELESMRLQIGHDKARHDTVTREFRAAATKMHQENVRFNSS